MNWFKRNKFLILLTLLILAFYWPFLFKGRLPVPSDTIVGMYHPFRDNIWNNFTAGVPFKNPLITDPVRQQYIWRDLAMNQIKDGRLPLWNPYSFSGTLLLANFQTAAFYPLNFLYFLLPHPLAWSWQIVISHLMLGIFLYLYLKNLNLSPLSSFFGSFAFSFSGFVIAWLTWNTIIHVAAWSILALLAIDKIVQRPKTNDYRPIIWYFIFTLSLVSAFLAGHLQIFFYSFLLIFSYLLFRLFFQKKNRIKIFFAFVSCFLLFIIFTLPQSIPTIKFIADSARDTDLGQWTKPGWFVPWQNLVQFLIPDFFGNPVTGNYFGIWNYAEFISFIGVLPLILALFASVFLINRETFFFSILFFLSLLFALPTPLAKIPFIFNLPLISTAQPSRLLFLTDFSLSVLAAFGLDGLLKKKQADKVFFVLLVVFVLFILFWFAGTNPVSRRNLILPSLMFLASVLILVLPKMKFIFSPGKLSHFVFPFLIVSLTVFDLFRFSWKFIPFTDKGWLFPETKIIKELKNDSSLWRLISLDRRIMPANFSAFYRFQDVSGYDPLYLKSYNLLVSSWNSGKPESFPGSFNRIVTPQRYDSVIADLLNIKYVLSYEPLVDPDPDLTKVLSEGSTYLYRKNNFFPRAWLTDSIIKVNSQKEELAKIFELKENLLSTAVTSENFDFQPGPASRFDSVKVVSWSSNNILVRTKSDSPKLLVLSEIYHPSWHAKIDGIEIKIIRVNYLLRGIPLKSGEHFIEFYAALI